MTTSYPLTRTQEALVAQIDRMLQARPQSFRIVQPISSTDDLDIVVATIKPNPFNCPTPFFCLGITYRTTAAKSTYSQSSRSTGATGSRRDELKVDGVFAPIVSNTGKWSMTSMVLTDERTKYLALKMPVARLKSHRAVRFQEIVESSVSALHIRPLTSDNGLKSLRNQTLFFDVFAYWARSILQKAAREGVHIINDQQLTDELSAGKFYYQKLKEEKERRERAKAEAKARERALARENRHHHHHRSDRSFYR